jgi:hypothetical protein
MTIDHRKVSAEIAQGILLDDPSFLREIVERVLQEMLEAEMTEHIGAAPYERSATRTGHRNGYKPRTLRTRVGTLNLLVPQDREGTFSTRLFSRYQRNEKALVLLAHGNVRGGSLHQEGQGSDRRAVRHLLLKEPHLFSGHFPRLGAQGVEKPQARGRKLSLPVRGRSLREGEGRWTSGESRSARRLGREERRLQGDLRCGSCSEEWITGRRYLDMQELEEYRPQKRHAEELAPMEQSSEVRFLLGRNYRNLRT